MYIDFPENVKELLFEDMWKFHYLGVFYVNLSISDQNNNKKCYSGLIKP